ncbi:esterase/lipase family protein [Streptomyces sp. NPDC002120]|uniref:esterase/lipase family protein n=1 Tax=Streptomyces sp. NPDC002120 TaxID=3364631 RepID=UPI003684BC6F
MARARVTDLVVVLPGIMGSRLANADGKPVWDLSGRALWRGLRTLGGALTRLSLPKDIGDGHPGDGVVPVGLMSDLHVIPGIWHPVDGYTDLLGSLERRFTLSLGENLLPFPYDWRLSCRYNAECLKSVVEPALERWQASAPERREARVVFLCHSMGGLVARHYVERLGGHQLTRRLITLGTPHRGSLDALVNLVNGRRMLGLDLGGFARSLPSLHQLTPDYACVTGPEGLAYARDLPGLPGVDAALLADAARFHADLRKASDHRTDIELHAITGVGQPTATTAEFADGRLIPRQMIGGQDEAGDGTVPRLASRPANAAGTGYAVPESHTPCEQHGSLQNNRGVRDALYGLLGHEAPFHRGEEGSDVQIGVSAPPLVEAGRPYEVRVTVPSETARQDRLVLTAELLSVGNGPQVINTLQGHGGGRYSTTFPAPTPGAYRLVVGQRGRSESRVTALTLVGVHCE